MLFSNSDFKSSCYTTHSVCLRITRTSTGFQIKWICAHAPVENGKFWLSILGLNFMCACVIDLTGSLWLEPRVFPDVTILRCMFAVYTHTCPMRPNCVHPVLISVMLLNQWWRQQQQESDHRGLQVLIWLLSGPQRRRLTLAGRDFQGIESADSCWNHRMMYIWSH